MSCQLAPQLYERTAVSSGYNPDKTWLYIVADVAYGQSAVLANQD